MNLLDQARRFLSLADRDMKAFQVLRVAPGISLVTAYFHAQQAVEKSLKAVLISRGVEFRKTHDLNELAYLLQDNGLTLPYTPEELARVTPYAATFRYDEMEITTIPLEEVVTMVETVRRWAGEQIQ